MLDFLMISTRPTKRGFVEVYPKFIIKKSSDLMIRAGDFYAIWIEDKNIWSIDEQDAIELIDKELDSYVKDNQYRFDCNLNVLHMWDSSTGMIDVWHKYCQKQMRDSFHPLDKKILFLNDTVQKKDYATKKLDYSLEQCETPNYDKLMTTLYSQSEREKIEWAIGSIITGDSKKNHKFEVLYGRPGTGKSTVLDLIARLFRGYCSVFDAKSLGSNKDFALETMKNNPMVAIQHDGDLSKIEDNTKLNSLISHEEMVVNEKHKSLYTTKFESFLFLGTNDPVKITNAQSGIIRRLIDVSPTGEKIPLAEFKKIKECLEFELGGIAYKCKEFYLSNPNRYEDYVPKTMMEASNDFYNFVLDSYHVFKEEDGVSMKTAWTMYKTYCENANVLKPVSQRIFREELKNYFDEYIDRFTSDEGERFRSYYSGFKMAKVKNKVEQKNNNWLNFEEQKSIFDDICGDFQAQYANSKETPTFKWEKVKTTLKDIDTAKLHYVKVPENHIVIDFDIPDKDGNKSFELNYKEASKWPKTYAELSKSGQGIHLHYIYAGDASKLSRIYDDKIEIKVFTGNSSLRRKLTKCNSEKIASISSGLPLKGENKVINFESVNSEKALRTLIKRCLNKEYEPYATGPLVDLIYKNLESAYNSGLKYDVSDMRNSILAFAANSTHQADRCVKLVNSMKFKSEEPSANKGNDNAPLVHFDVEVFPNLFVVCWKYDGEGKTVVPLINPKPEQIEDLLQYRLIGFNNRRYDNHISYGCLMGYTNEELYNLSQRIVNDKSNKSFFSEAYNISYTDIYDYSSKKQSVKKWEFELGIFHHECDLPWDKPVPKEKWEEIVSYCKDDVLAQEAIWNATQEDFMARKIQVELVKSMYGISDVSVNDTTNSLSQKIIFGKNKAPQAAFNYRDLSKPVSYKEYKRYRELFGIDYNFRVFDQNGIPQFRKYDGKEILPDGWSILPFFPGYIYEMGKSTYLDQEIGEGGRVYAEPGMYFNVWDGDVSSMHPHSIIYECLFGKEYTKIFKELVDARVAIKHKDFDKAGMMLNGVLKPYLKEEYAKGLAQALKIVINSIYGLTSASFTNAFRDKRNIDNIVAKRGALFMTLLKDQVEKLGYKVAHIKTDSIKIPNADEFIKDFVIKFGKEYGYSFETEEDFDRYCLINDAVYVGKTKGEKTEWVTVGTQFSVPYVKKTLFTHEDILFKDMCELKSCKTALYLDFCENLPEGEHNYKFVGKNGMFCPMVKGVNAGILYRQQDDKYNSVTGTKGYLWMESDIVQTLGLQEQIDKSYYINLVNDAIDTIKQYGDFEMFVADDSKDEESDILKSDPLPDGWEKANA